MTVSKRALQQVIASSLTDVEADVRSAAIGAVKTVGRWLTEDLAVSKRTAHVVLRHGGTWRSRWAVSSVCDGVTAAESDVDTQRVFRTRTSFAVVEVDTASYQVQDVQLLLRKGNW